MKMTRWIMAAGTAAILCLGVNQGLAQQNNPGGRQGRGNFDPAQFRERMMQNLREQLEVTDDSEWKAIEPMVQKVMDARMASVRESVELESSGGIKGGFNFQYGYAKKSRPSSR